jgi:hypothetical protein
VPVVVDPATTPKHGMPIVSVKGKAPYFTKPSKATFIGVSRGSFQIFGPLTSMSSRSSFSQLRMPGEIAEPELES